MDLETIPTPTPTPEPTLSPVPDIDYTEHLTLISEKIESLQEFLEVHFVDVANIAHDVDILGNDLQDLLELLQYVPHIAGYAEYIAGFGLFAVVVALCYFSYKFFKMFF